MDVDYQNTFAETLCFTLYQMLFAKSMQLATGLGITIIAVGSFTLFSTLPVALVAKIVAVVAVVLASMFLAFLAQLIYVIVAYLAFPKSRAQACHLAVSETGFTVQLPEAESHIKWAAVEKIRRVLGLVLIYFSDTQAWIVPNRAFSSPAAAEQFYAFVVQSWLRGRTKQ